MLLLNLMALKVGIPRIGKIGRCDLPQIHCIRRIRRIRRIAIVGPESSGKTTLARALANHFCTAWVPEYAREYLDNLGHAYEERDLLSIARGQLRLEAQAKTKAREILFCDTDMMTIEIWSQVRYARVDPRLVALVNDTPYDHTLLTDANIPWAADPLREHPHDRPALFARYRNALESRGCAYDVIAGDRQTRLPMAVAIVDKLRHADHSL